MNAIARDVRIWAVADKGSTPPGFGYQGLILRREALDNGTVHSAADLRGRKVSVPSRGSGAQASLDKALRREGLTTDDVDITPLNFPDMEAGFAGGAIDGAIVIEPFLSSIVDHGVGHLYARNDEYYPNQQVAVVLYSNQFAREQPDVARRLMIGYLKGVRDFNDAWVKGDAAKHEAVINALVKHTPIKDRGVRAGGDARPEPEWDDQPREPGGRPGVFPQHGRPAAACRVEPVGRPAVCRLRGAGAGALPVTVSGVGARSTSRPVARPVNGGFLSD